MAREKKKPKKAKDSKAPHAQHSQGMGTPTASVEAANQPHNIKKEALGPNTKY